MEGLPPELLANILDILQGNGFERLSPYSSVSRAWQATVEKRTFREIWVNIDPNDIEKLHSVIVSEFAAALSKRSFAKLRILRIRLAHYECRDEARDPTCLVPLGTCEDEPTLRIMQRLSTLPQLTTLHLTGSQFVGVNFFSSLPHFPKLLDFQLDVAASTIDGKWFFVSDEGLTAKIKGFGEEESTYGFGEEESTYDSDSDSDRADPVELYDSDDEDGPLIQRMDWFRHFRTMPNPKTIPEFLINAANWFARQSHLLGP
ncbi:hypothetical protein N0V87_002273 [Didymella glomerata]|uniref:F-box domain-containing protein n=1 Tax=Didymella glomerata TaxID=749621 RepID=A0A9W8X4L4_9PLEO|nr:hypothetical protein N0V87_002273 [Didymella glomerata]